jgi:hypothetical protein
MMRLTGAMSKANSGAAELMLLLILLMSLLLPGLLSAAAPFVAEPVGGRLDLLWDATLVATTLSTSGVNVSNYNQKTTTKQD